MTTPKTKRARTLRRNQTDAETKFWRQLRDRRLDGLKFRRQVPLGPYVVDFLCAEHMMVIELDGGQHADTASRDRKRTDWLEDEGYRVVRFWNNEVMENIEGVLDRILHLIEK